MHPSPKHHSKLGNSIRKHKGMFLLFTIFISLVFFSIYFAFNIQSSDKSENNNPNKLTGFITKEPTEKIKTQIKATLTIPILEIRTKSSKIKIVTGKVNTVLFAGSEKFDLSKVGESEIIISDFDGKISFDNENILNLDGKAGKISMNGIPTTPQSRDYIKIKVSEDFLYKSIKVEDVSIKSLSYLTSGSANIDNGKIEVIIKREKFGIWNFNGDLSLFDDSLTLEGETDKIEITGEHNIRID